MPEKSHSNWYRKGGISMPQFTNIITGLLFGGQVSCVANSMHRKDYPYSLLFNPPIYSSEVQIYYLVKLALSHNPANRAVLWPIEFLLYNIFANELYSRKRYLDDTTRHETWSKTLTGR